MLRAWFKPAPRKDFLRSFCISSRFVLIQTMSCDPLGKMCGRLANGCKQRVAEFHELNILQRLFCPLTFTPDLLH